MDLVKIAWDRREWGSRRSNYERPESVKRPEIRIGLIRLMYSLGQLGLLLKDEQNWPTAEEEAEIGKLITHESFYVLRGDEGSGNPRDLEEASFAGSKAADVLLLLRVKRAEKRRLEERREARRKLENAKANLNRLG